ncbi:ankyrin repeat domain-containing protein [Luteimonas sp. S4-F44]|uniref:ankyrin repeat domain-containing protein n=1 Tax=Luteimonas sp. S4-F44 TaxID=2925842 RepID=UPI001F538668|nr:ankyrin repeat domain-containing protein [Luteimonas sp. S4-F44]UNK42381.1 ankyrin repeat domain-containing protein [Luteimonas sp. S4-F44]
MIEPLSPLTATRARACVCALLLVAAQSACARQGPNMSHDPSTDPGTAALARAAHSGDLADAKRLIADGANPDATDADGTPLLQAAILRGDRRGFETLLEAGADPAAAAANGNTALHVAAMQDDPTFLKTLLARGLSPDTPNARSGETPLFNALEARNDDAIGTLLTAGAKVDATDRYGATLLHKAARINATGWVVRFLEAGADPTARDRVGATFQPSFFRPRDAVLTPQARSDREKVRAWLVQRRIPVEDKH